MEKRIALVAVALAVVAALAVISGVAQASNVQFAAQGSRGDGMIGRGAGSSGGMMGGCGGMNWAGDNVSSCSSYTQHCRASNYQP